MRLYGDPSSGNVYKPQMLLGLLGIRYEHIPTSWEDGGTSDPAFLQLNPNGKVPCLVDGDFVLWESNAILCYLAEGTEWLPNDVQARAHVMQWLFWEQYSHEPYIATSRAITHYENDPAKRKERLARKRAGGEHALQLMETHLRNNEWFVGKAPTIADLCLYAYTHVAHEGGFELLPYPGIRAWLSRVETIPSLVQMAPFATKTT